MEIRQQQFDTQFFRGCDVRQVDAYLNGVAEDFEALLKENSLLKEQLAVLEERNRGIEEREKILQETLITAQRLTEELKEAAKREAQLIVREAEIQAEKIMAGARVEEAKIKQEVLALHRVRHQVAEGIRSSIEMCQRLIANEFKEEWKHEGPEQA